MSNHSVTTLLIKEIPLFRGRIRLAKDEVPSNGTLVGWRKSTSNPVFAIYAFVDLFVLLQCSAVPAGHISSSTESGSHKLSILHPSYNNWKKSIPFERKDLPALLASSHQYTYTEPHVITSPIFFPLPAEWSIGYSNAKLEFQWSRFELSTSRIKIRRIHRRGILPSRYFPIRQSARRDSSFCFFISFYLGSLQHRVSQSSVETP